MFRILALTCSGLLFLAGCGSPEARRAARPTPSLSATPNPALTPPPKPGRAMKRTPSGAATFVAYWIKILNYAVNSGDVSLLGSLSLSGCVGCKEYVDSIQVLTSDTAIVEEFEWEVRDLNVKSEGRIEVDVRANGYRRRESLDRDWSLIDPAKYKVEFNLVWCASTWRVAKLYRMGER